MKPTNAPTPRLDRETLNVAITAVAERLYPADVVLTDLGECHQATLRNAIKTLERLRDLGPALPVPAPVETPGLIGRLATRESMMRAWSQAASEGSFYRRHFAEIADELAEAAAALQSGGATPTWREMSDCKRDKIVLVWFRNSHGKNRVVRAYYAEPRSVEVEDADAPGVDYCTETETAYLPEGWYEATEFDEDRPSFRIAEELLGWMPLPAAPASPPVEDK